MAKVTPRMAVLENNIKAQGSLKVAVVEKTIFSHVKPSFAIVDISRADAIEEGLPFSINAKSERKLANVIDTINDTSRVVVNGVFYENAGYREKMIGSIFQLSPTDKQSNNGMAIGNKQGGYACAYVIVPDLMELWIRADVYSVLAPWITLGAGGGNLDEGYGVVFNHNQYGFYKKRSGSPSVYTNDGDDARSYVIHLKSDKDNGIIELYGKNGLLGTYNGNVNNGEPFAYFFVKSERNTCVSDMVLSSTPLSIDDHAKIDEKHVSFPDLTSNGVIGVDDFAVARSDGNANIYQLFNCEYPYSNCAWKDGITIFIKNKIVIHSVHLQLRRNCTLKSYIYGSNDNENYVLLDTLKFNNSTLATSKALQFYHYYKIKTSDDTQGGIQHISVNASLDDGLTFDTGRMVSKSVNDSFGSRRCITEYASIIGDTRKEVCHSVAGVSDTCRRTSLHIDRAYDTMRCCYDKNIRGVVFGCDTRRRVLLGLDNVFETERKTGYLASHYFDTKREIHNDSDAVCCFDTLRKTVIKVHLRVDTKEKIVLKQRLFVSSYVYVNGGVRLKVDTRLTVPSDISIYPIDGENVVGSISSRDKVKSVSISINESTISDSMQFELINSSFEPRDAIHGRILDYDYSMSVNQTVQEGIVTKVNTQADIRQLKSSILRYPDFDGTGKPKKTDSGTRVEHTISNKGIGGLDINFYVLDSDSTTRSPTTKASKHLQYIAGAMGLTADCSFDDFVPSNGCAYQASTVLNLVGNFFSWTKEVPWRQINLFIRGTTLHAVQRGHEKGSVDITNMRHTRPVITKTPILIYKTLSKLKRKNVSSEIDINMQYTDLTDSGDVSGFDTGKTYNRVFYDMMHRPIFATATDADGSSETIMYSYAGWQIREHHAVETASGYKYSYDVWTTNLGNNHAMVNHGADGRTDSIAFTTNAILKMFETPSTARLDISASLDNYNVDYEIERNDAFGNSTTYHSASNDKSTPFPIVGDDINQQLFSEVEQYNSFGVTIQVSVDVVSPVINGVPEYRHIIDFQDKIILDGETYYLQSNNISVNANELKQSLSIVRWKK